MRIEANVPIKNNRVVEGGHGRLAQVVPEIKKLSKKGAKMILISHLGRPEGKSIKGLSLRPVATQLSKLSGLPVKFMPEVVGKSVEKMVDTMQDGDIVMLENLRFDSREEKNSARFAKMLAGLGDIYINNAFGTAHRKVASAVAITKYLPSFAGDLMAKEVGELLKPFKAPFVVLLGGIKLHTKLPMIKNVSSHSSAILTGGGIAVTFLAAKYGKPLKLDHEVISKIEIKTAEHLLKECAGKIFVPIDFRVLRHGEKGVKTVHAREVLPEDDIFDIGHETGELYRRILITSGSVVWNGAFGKIEDKRGEGGTEAIAKILSGLKDSRTVLGGGDTVTFVEKKGLTKKLNFVSTGGGAMMAFLAGQDMPALEPLVVK